MLMRWSQSPAADLHAAIEAVEDIVRDEARQLGIDVPVTMPRLLAPKKRSGWMRWS
jgi:hypothetical protein